MLSPDPGKPMANALVCGAKSNRKQYPLPPFPDREHVKTLARGRISSEPAVRLLRGTKVIG